MSMYITGKIKEGKIVVDRFFQDEVLKNEGAPVEIIINPKDLKTKAQLGYLWGHVFKVVAQTGFTEEEVYELFLQKFSSYTKVKDGKKYTFTKRLSEMSKKETGEFIDKILHYCRTSETLRDFEIHDPDPEWNH